MSVLVSIYLSMMYHQNKTENQFQTWQSVMTPWSYTTNFVSLFCFKLPQHYMLIMHFQFLHFMGMKS